MAVLAAVLAVSVLLGGCQGRQDTAGTREETGETVSAPAGEAAKDTTETTSGNAAGGTGRFMEEEVSLPENFDAILDMEKLQDGRIRLVGFQWKEGEAEGSVWDSSDGGGSWEKQEALTEALNGIGESGSPSFAAVSPKGSLYASFTKFDENQNLEAVYSLLSEDGTVEERKAPIPGEQILAEGKFLDEETMVFRSSFQVYVYDLETDSVKYQLPKMEDAIQALMVIDRKIFVLNYKGAYIYDGDTGSELILPSGVQENLYEPLDEMSGGVNFVTDIVGAFDGSDGFYFMNSQGIFHQTWTGSMSEQLLAGELGALSQSSFYSMAVVDSERLLAAVSNDGRAKVLSFQWNQNAPSRPETELRIYSLRENSEISQAIVQYQKQHPEILIHLEVGLDGSEGASQDDLVKALNTEIMAGKGPDLLLLDGMNIEAYQEKGMLSDLSGLWEKGDDYFDAVLSAYEKNGKVCALPLRFQIPIMFTGNPEAFDYETVSGMEGIFQSDANLLLKFWDTCGGSIQKEDGTLDEEALRSFLSDVKTMKGDGGRQEQTIESGSTAISTMLLRLLNQREDTAVGTLESGLDFATLTTIGAQLGGEYEYGLMAGSQENIYVPTEIIGVSSRSTEGEAAMEFVRYLLTDEAQSIERNDGLPVRKETFRNVLTKTQGVSCPITDEEGNLTGSLDVSPASQEEADQLLQLAESLTIPAPTDQIVKETVIEQGSRYLSGEQDLDITVDTITQRINLYLAE